jgi:hypothetical protein
MMTGVRLTVEALPSGPDGLIGAAMIVNCTDSQGFLALMDKAVATVKTLPADEDIKPVMDALVYRTGAEAAGDTAIHHMVLDLAKTGEMSQSDLEEMAGILGKDGLLFRFAAAGKDKVLITFGGGAAYMQRLMEQALKPGAPLESDAGIQAVAPHLPADRASVFYFALDNTVELVRNIGKAMGENDMPINLGPVNAPVAFTTCGAQGWLDVDVFVPTGFMIAIKDMVLTLTGPGEIEF